MSDQNQKLYWSEFFKDCGFDASDVTKYTGLFCEHKVGPNSLNVLDADRLQRLGVEMIGHQILILAKIEERIRSEKSTSETDSHSNMAEKLALHGWSYPTDFIDSIFLIGIMTARLDINCGILSACFSRSILEMFKKNHLYNYMPAAGIKNEKTLRVAYEAFYMDKKNPAANHVRDMLKITPEQFAKCCLTTYKNCSQVVHSVAELYYKFNCQLDRIRHILARIPDQTEDQQSCIAAIKTIPKEHNKSRPTGSTNFGDDYYADP